MGGTATVAFLFVDMVGSTDMLRRLGDDANDEVRRRYMATLRQALADNDGREVKNLGDGLMAAFDRSLADAARCAIDMQRGVDRLRRADPLLQIQIRVGLSVGEAAPEGGDWQGTPVVEAARLEPKARPGQILANDVVRLLLGNRGGFVCTPAGDYELKGFDEPLACCDIAWEPDPGLPEVPLPAGLARGALALAGRDREMEPLRAQWDRVVAGGSAAVVIVGEPGVGKSRLAAELAGLAHTTGATVLYGRCDDDTVVPDQPIAEALRWYVAACAPSVLREQVADSAVLVRLVPSLTARVPELANPGLPVAGRSELTSAVCSFVTRAAAAKKVLLVLDDLQYAPPSTLELITALATSEAAGLMVLAASRREDEFADTPAFERIALRGLSVDGTARLIEERLAVLPEPPAIDVREIAATVVAETGGNPDHVLEVIERVASAGALNAAASEQRAAVVAAAVETCPYKGLLAFQSEDADIFFGREEDVAALLSRLAGQRLLAVVGASGSGKSSIVRAGVLPALRRGALAGSERWPIVVVTPGPHPLTELAAGCATPLGLGAGALLARLEGDPSALARAVTDSSLERLIVFVDQFEEMFTLCNDAEERSRFVDALLAAAAAPGGPVLVLLAMRADFFGLGASVPGLASALEASTSLLGPMDEDALRMAIEQPARVAGLKIERGLVDLMLRDVAGEPGSLPLLSHALLETWKRRNDRTLTVGGYRECGGVRGAIARTAESVYIGLPEGQQQLARSVFLRLTELGEGTEDTRRRVSLDELRSEGESSPELDQLVRTLTDARLLTTSDQAVEVAHEALIREWPRLRAWLDEDREGIRALRHLTDSARSWDDLARDSAELYRGPRLIAALDWSKDSGVTLSPREREFLDASRDYADRERRESERRTRRLRVLLGAAALFLVMSAVAGVVALGQRNEARDSTARALAAQTAADARRIGALGLSADDFDRALLLAVEARRLDDSTDTRSNLLAVLNEKPQVVGVIGNQPGDSLFDFVVTGDGDHLAAIRPESYPLYDATTLQPTGAELAVPVFFADGVPTPDGTGYAIVDITGGGEDDETDVVPSVRFFDGTTGKETREAIPLRLPNDEEFFEPTVALSPDGRWLVVSSAADPDDGSPAFEAIWDLRRPLSPPRRIEYGGDVPQVAFTIDNRLVVAGDDSVADSGLYVLDPATGALLSAIPNAHRPIAVDPTGPRVVARTVESMAVWNLETGRREHPLPSGAAIESVAYAPNGRSIATAWQDRSLTIWNPENGAPTHRLAGHTSPVGNLQFVDGDATLFTTGHDGVVIAWDLAGDRRVVEQIVPNGDDTGPPVNLAMPRPDGGAVAYITEGDPFEQWQVFDLAATKRGPFFSSESPFVIWDDWTPDGRFLVTVGDDTMARLWNPTSGKKVAEQALPFDSNSGSVGWRPDGKTIFAGLHEGGVVELDAATLKIVGEPLKFPKYVPNVDVSPDGRMLAVAQFDEDAKVNSVLLVDYATRKVLTTLEGVDASWRLNFSPDGSLLAAGGSNGLVTLIDPKTRTVDGQRLQGVDGPVIALAFAANSKFLVTGSFDGTVELWDLERRARIARVTPGDPGRATYAWFDATGDNVIVASENGGVWTFSSSPDEWQRRACAIAGRNFSRDEWTELMGDRPYRKTCPGLPAPE